ncbi:MAG: hypothetical protein VX546_03075, partial [Myxococcota bacterium]|nr:hypothetical protein [Myxococcota bacterium]
MPQILLEPEQIGNRVARNWIAVVAIGAAHLAEWERYAKDSIIAYAANHGLGVVLFTDNLDPRDDRKHPA